jgi:hypothetical protein
MPSQHEVRSVAGMLTTAEYAVACIPTPARGRHCCALLCLAAGLRLRLTGLPTTVPTDYGLLARSSKL